MNPRDGTGLMCWQARQTYPGEQASPGRARQFCSDQFTARLGTSPESDEVRDRALIVVSELITNAVNAQAAQATLSVEFHHGRVRLSVLDDAAGQPRQLQPGPNDEHGRGLAIVARIATDWGVEDSPRGKRVWAELSLPPGVGAQLECSLY